MIYTFDKGLPSEGQFELKEGKVTKVADVPQARTLFYKDQPVLVNTDFDVICFLGSPTLLERYEECGFQISTIYDKHGKAIEMMPVEYTGFHGVIVEVEEV